MTLGSIIEGQEGTGGDGAPCGDRRDIRVTLGSLMEGQEGCGGDGVPVGTGETLG